jgi:hypothetical protein
MLNRGYDPNEEEYPEYCPEHPEERIDDFFCPVCEPERYVKWLEAELERDRKTLQSFASKNMRLEAFLSAATRALITRELTDKETNLIKLIKEELKWD